jgi:DNA-binding CsgD family transcriptional regulator/tetratricopeptide (TPR) repeat protein
VTTPAGPFRRPLSGTINGAVLVERERPLARLGEILDEAAGGAGHLVLLGGEAGIGKSTLVATFAASGAGRMLVRRGACDDVGTATALGPLMDAFPELAEEIEHAEGADRAGLPRRVRATLAGEPTLLVLEDLHWADEATLGVLRFLGRRLAGLPTVVVATFRDDEAPAGSPLALLIGDLASVPEVTRMSLCRLSVDGVRRLAERAGSPLDAAVLHRSTEGNPFFVTEVLAAGGTELPATVRDAVLARTARRSPAAQRVLAAAAVLGPRAELRMLVAVSGAPADAVDECVRAGVLVADGEGWSFRHELSRRAVEASLAPGERAGLHAVALRELEGERDDARLAHHAAGSGDRDAVLEHAPRAAARAARLGAHREAADLYRLALRFAGPSDPRRAELYEALSYECYLTNEMEEALAARQAAREVAEATGDERALGIQLTWLSRLFRFLWQSPEAVRLADQAIATLERVDDGHALAMAYAHRAGLAMLATDTEAAVLWADRAVELARTIGDVEVEAHALTTIGTALVSRYDSAEGWAQIRRGLELALSLDAHEHAGRTYLNLTALGLQNRRYADLERDLREGGAYCDERDLDAFGTQILLGVGRALAEQGRYAEADEVLVRARSRMRLSSINRMALTHQSGGLAARRHGGGEDDLDEAWRLADASGEEQQRTPVATMKAEGHWIRGERDAAAAVLDRVWDQAVGQANPWSVGELCWWLDAAGAPRRPPVRVAEPLRLMLEGEWRAAAEAWEEVGCPLWVAYALGRSPDLADARRAVAITGEIGAHAAQQAILRDRRERGLPVPHGPRSATRANPLRLTRRELEILELLAEGLTNPEMARRLYLSERTVAHHVSAVLQKLGEPNRSRAVVAAVRQGIVAGPESA